MVILTIALILVAAISNALMYLSSEGRLYSKNVNLYRWLNKELSWRFKYEKHDPRWGEKFPGSTTIFVFLTDGWHLFQFIFHTCWQTAIAIQFERWFISFVVIKVVFGVLFQIIYSRIKNRSGRK